MRWDCNNDDKAILLCVKAAYLVSFNGILMETSQLATRFRTALKVQNLLRLAILSFRKLSPKATGRILDLPGFCGERLAHLPGLSLEGDGALEAER